MDNLTLKKELTKIFFGIDRYSAHKKAADILRKIASDKIFFNEIIENNLRKPEFLFKKRHYPTLAFEIAETPHYNLMANIFLPLPNKRTDISLQSIHHHGNLLLTTVSTFGPGYDSILFKKEYKLDYKTGKTLMQSDKLYHNELNNLEFVDAYTPHLVFFPADLSITFALWSNCEKSSLLDRLKKNKLLRQLKKPLVSFIRLIGMEKVANINTVEYFDFYPENGTLFALKDRVKYPVGTNENFLQNVFHVLQKVGYRNEEFLILLKSNSKYNPAAHKWIDKLLNNEKIEALFEEIHVEAPKAHILRKDILESINIPH